MLYAKAGDSISFRFGAHNGAGSAEDASSGPAGVLVVNGVDDSASITITDVGDGDYRFQGTFPGDLSVGDQCQWRVNATIDSQTPIWFSETYVIVDVYPWELATAAALGTPIDGDIATDLENLSDQLAAGVDVLTIEDTDATDYFTALGAAIRSGLATATNVTDATTTLGGLITALQAKILRWFRLALRKDAAVATDHSTELAELNADAGTGTGAFDNVTDSDQARADAIDAIEGGGGGPAVGAFEISFTVQIGGADLPEADVIITQVDSAIDENVVDARRSNANALVTFPGIDAGTYWVHVQKVGVPSPAAPVQLTVIDGDNFSFAAV